MVLLSYLSAYSEKASAQGHGRICRIKARSGLVRFPVTYGNPVSGIEGKRRRVPSEFHRTANQLTLDPWCDLVRKGKEDSVDRWEGYGRVEPIRARGYVLGSFE